MECIIFTFLYMYLQEKWTDPPMHARISTNTCVAHGEMKSKFLPTRALTPSFPSSAKECYESVFLFLENDFKLQIRNIPYKT